MNSAAVAAANSSAPAIARPRHAAAWRAASRSASPVARSAPGAPRTTWIRARSTSSDVATAPPVTISHDAISPNAGGRAAAPSANPATSAASAVPIAPTGQMTSAARRSGP